MRALDLFLFLSLSLSLSIVFFYKKNRTAISADVHNTHDSYSDANGRYVDTLPGKDDDELREDSSKLMSVYLNEHTSDCAKLAAGSLVSITEAVMEGVVNNGVAIIRPPGIETTISRFYLFLL